MAIGSGCKRGIRHLAFVVVAASSALAWGWNPEDGISGARPGEDLFAAACRLGHLEAVQYYMSLKGFDPGQEFSTGYEHQPKATGLRLAVENQQIQLLKVMLEEEEITDALNSDDGDGIIAMVRAANNQELTKLFKDYLSKEDEGASSPALSEVEDALSDAEDSGQEEQGLEQEYSEGEQSVVGSRNYRGGHPSSRSSLPSYAGRSLESPDLEIDQRGGRASLPSHVESRSVRERALYFEQVFAEPKADGGLSHPVAESASSGPNPENDQQVLHADALPSDKEFLRSHSHVGVEEAGHGTLSTGAHLDVVLSMLTEQLQDLELRSLESVPHTYLASFNRYAGYKKTTEAVLAELMNQLAADLEREHQRAEDTNDELLRTQADLRDANELLKQLQDEVADQRRLENLYAGTEPLEYEGDEPLEHVDGEHPLITAARGGRADAVTQFVEQEPSLVNQPLNSKVDGRDTGTVTPLYAAAEAGLADVVKVLLNAGADPEKGKVTGETPLGVAVENHNWDVADQLLDVLRDHEPLDGYIERPTVGDKQIIDAFNKACHKNDYQTVEQMLSKFLVTTELRMAERKGLDVRAVTGMDIVSRFGHTQTAVVLINHGADIDSMRAVVAAGHEQTVVQPDGIGETEEEVFEEYGTNQVIYDAVDVDGGGEQHQSEVTAGIVDGNLIYQPQVTPLAIAAGRNHFKLAELLVSVSEGYSDSTAASTRTTSKISHASAVSAMNLAIVRNHFAIVQLLHSRIAQAGNLQPYSQQLDNLAALQLQQHKVRYHLQTCKKPGGCTSSYPTPLKGGGVYSKGSSYHFPQPVVLAPLPTGKS